MRVAVAARSSGDEKETGQDCAAQAQEVKNGCEARGHEVVGVFLDDGVAGDSDPYSRPGLYDARALVLSGQADAVAMRGPNRYSRAHPALAVSWFNEEEVEFLFLSSDSLTTAGKPRRRPEEYPTGELVKLVEFFGPWQELVGIRSTTQGAMTEIKEGRRPTKSGKPHHRPVVQIDAKHLEAARAVMAEGKPFAEAFRLVNELRVDGAKDPETIEKRKLGKGTLARALGLWSSARPSNVERAE